jgi:glycosyltransferase involved in cell wall biosynthesis
MPRVSIAIRAFRRRWLAEAIASVLAQSHRDLELVIYDDAGDLEPLAAATGDPRVRYHRAERPRTAGGRFAAAVALCRGAYVGVLDDDDAYAPDFVLALVSALDADPQVGIAFCRTTWEGERGRIMPADPRPAGLVAEAATAMLRDGWTVTPSHLLFRRSAYDAVFGPSPMPSGVSPDVLLNVRLATQGWRHVLVDTPLVVTRWHAEQLSRVSVAALDREVSTWRALVLLDPVLAAHRDRRLARALLARAASALRAGDREQAGADLAAAAATSPAEWRGRHLALRAAAACGGPGVAALGLYGWWWDRRRRLGPPRRLGDR